MTTTVMHLIINVGTTLSAQLPNRINLEIFQTALCLGIYSLV